ncbi:MAG: tetratricopeptide repeat protein, partial [Sphingomonadales bacterium]
NLGLTHLYSGNAMASVECFERALEAEPGFLKARFFLAKGLNLTGRHEAALESLDESIIAYPEMPDFHVERSDALMRLSQLDEAQKSAREALRLQPDSATALAALGTIQWMKGELDEAIKSYTRSLEIQPEEPSVHTNFAVVLQNLRRFDEAIDSFRRALGIDPDYSDARGNMAYLFSNLDRMDEARRTAREGLERKPQDPFMHFVLGRCERMEGRHQEAVNRLKPLVELLGEGRLLSETLFELGKAFDELGEKDKAGKYFSRAVQIGEKLPVVVGRGLQETFK